MRPLFQNEDWFVIDKPTGISSQAAFAGDVAVPEWLALHHGADVRVISRLDKGTSGVMIMAKNAAAAARAQKIHETGSSSKEYVFLSASDSVKSGRGKVWEVATAIDGKSASTAFERVGPAGKFFLYRAKLARGRVHQIRRHAKESKVPVLGDDKYGGAAYPRLCLHCKSVAWPEIAEELAAKVPPSMGSLGDFSGDPDFLVSFDRRLSFHEGITDAFRCVHRGETLAADCAVDFYGGWLCAWIYDEARPLSEIEAALAPHFKKLSSRYGARGVVIKRNLKNPHERGLVREQKTSGEAPPPYFDVTEHGLKYRVSLTEGQHAGLFLDQRDNRLRARKLAAGARVANLFAYTCSFSVAAAAGGAAEIVSVDAAKPCLETGAVNFDSNGLAGGGKFIQEDARAWLKRQRRKAGKEGDVARYGLIVCDPPTFATTKEGGAFSVDKEWEALASDCREILARNGNVLFCTNHREGGREDYGAVLREKFSSVLDVPAPVDFPVIDGRREHVKMFWCKA